MKKLMAILCLALLFSHAFARNEGKQKEPVFAGCLCCLIPGLGQFYNGDNVSGILFMTGWVTGNVMIYVGVGTEEYGLSVAGGVISFGVMVGSIVDAIVSANQQNQGGRRRHGYNLQNQALINLALNSKEDKMIALGMPRMTYQPKKGTLNITLVDARF